MIPAMCRRHITAGDIEMSHERLDQLVAAYNALTLTDDVGSGKKDRSKKKAPRHRKKSSCCEDDNPALSCNNLSPVSTTAGIEEMEAIVLGANRRQEEEEKVRQKNELMS